MALGVRELTLVLRARDEASRTLRGFKGALGEVDAAVASSASRSLAAGIALTTAGIGITSLGVSGIKAFSDMADAASDYDQQAAKTLTQTDGIGASLDQLKDIGRDIAKQLPVNFKEVQDSLYDIFSSMDVNVPQAKKLLAGIGQAAVAGQVDMETAGRGIIEVLNAYKMPAEDVNKVNDTMFQLVRKGVGTYGQFSNTIGRSIPSAVKAGQSFEDMAGGMAFLTRRGLSTAMASTALGRAFDALSKTKTQQNFKEIGISMTDAEGRFRPFADIMEDLRKKLEGLTPAAKAAKLEELFKGSGGTVQAMRAISHAVDDSGGSLQKLTADMKNSKGAAKEAYDVMSKTPQAKVQELKNQYEVMRTELGDKVLPIKMKLVEILTKILNAFNNLSPGVKDFIVKFLMIATVVATVVGIIMTIVGLFLAFSAAAALAGTSLGAIALACAPVIAAIAAIVAIGVLVVKNWSTIKAWAIATWGSLQKQMQPAVQALQRLWGEIQKLGSLIWSVVGPAVRDFWNSISKGAQDAWAKIQPAVAGLWAALQNLGANVGRIVTSIANFLGGLVRFLQSVFVPVFAWLWNIIGPIFRSFGEVVGNVVGMIGNLLGNLINIIKDVINLVVALFTGQWSQAWHSMLDIVSSIVNMIVTILKSLWDSVVSIVKGLVQAVIGFFTNLWDTLVGHSIIPDMVRAIIDWFGRLPGEVLNFITGLVSSIINWFSNLAINALAKTAELVNGVANWFAQLPGRVLSFVVGMVGSVISWHNTMALKAAAKVSELVNGVVHWFSGLPGKVISFVSSLVSQVVNWFANLSIKVMAKVISMIGSITSWFSGLPGKVMSAISSLAGKLLSAGASWMIKTLAGINSKAGEVWSFFSGLPGKVVGLVGNLGGTLFSAGTDLIGGFIRGIVSKAGDIVGVIKSKVTSVIPGFVKSALGIHSPSTVMAELAKWIPAGFAQGIKGNAGQVSAAMSALLANVRQAYNKKQISKAFYTHAKDLIATEKAQLLLALKNREAAGKAASKQDKEAAKRAKDRAAAAKKAAAAAAKAAKERAAAAEKARKAMNNIATYINADYIKGLTGTEKNIQTVSAGLIKKLGDALNAKAITKSKYDSLVKQVQAGEKRLLSIATQRDAVAARLKAAQENLANQIKLRDDLYNKIMDSTKQLRDITEFGSENNADVTSAGIIEGMQNNLAKIKKWQADMATLKRMGISSSLYQQLLEAGPEKGESIANALIQGGTAAIQKVNILQGQLDASANAMSTAAANSMYGAGISAAQGLVKGLQSQQAALNKAMENMADALVKSLKKQLGIKSPSTVMAKLGGYAGDGWIVGIKQKLSDIERAGLDMANASIQNPIRKPVLPVVLDSSHRMRTGPVYGLNRPHQDLRPTENNFNINVNTQEIDPTKHAAALGYEIARSLGR